MKDPENAEELANLAAILLYQWGYKPEYIDRFSKAIAEGISKRISRSRVVRVEVPLERSAEVFGIDGRYSLVRIDGQSDGVAKLLVQSEAFPVVSRGDVIPRYQIAENGELVPAPEDDE